MTRNSPYIVGLTGGIACGKSNVTAALLAAGAGVIDADEVSRSLTAPGGIALPVLRERFGDGMFMGDELNRKALADVVFADETAREALNAILHPMIFAQMERRAREYAGSPAVVLDVPLLYEVGYDDRCDEVWAVWAPKAAQMERLLARGLTQAEAEMRIASQMPALEKARRANRVLVTTGSRAQTAALAAALWTELLGRLAHA